MYGSVKVIPESGLTFSKRYYKKGPEKNFISEPPPRKLKLIGVTSPTCLKGLKLFMPYMGLNFCSDGPGLEPQSWNEMCLRLGAAIHAFIHPSIK